MLISPLFRSENNLTLSLFDEEPVNMLTLIFIFFNESFKLL